MVAEEREPVAADRGQPHQFERVRQGPAESHVDKVPAKRGHGDRKPLRRLVARPARLERGHGPRLQQIQPTVLQAPLDILRPTVVRLDALQQFADLRDLFVVQTGRVTQIRRHRPLLDTIAARDDHVLLVADAALGDLQRLFVELELIDFAFAGDDRFAESKVRVQEHPVDSAGDRIDRESHSRNFTLDLPLDDDGHSRVALTKSLVVPIQDGPVSPQRNEAVADPLRNAIGSPDVEVSVMLTGKRRRAKSSKVEEDRTANAPFAPPSSRATPARIAWSTAGGRPIVDRARASRRTGREADQDVRSQRRPVPAPASRRSSKTRHRLLQ